MLVSFPDRLASAGEELLAREARRIVAPTLLDDEGEHEGGSGAAENNEPLSSAAEALAQFVEEHFEALEKAGLRPGMRLEVFRNLDNEMAMADAITIWALVDRCEVIWEGGQSRLLQLDQDGNIALSCSTSGPSFPGKLATGFVRPEGFGEFLSFLEKSLELMP